MLLYEAHRRQASVIGMYVEQVSWIECCKVPKLCAVKLAVGDNIHLLPSLNSCRRSVSGNGNEQRTPGVGLGLAKELNCVSGVNGKWESLWQRSALQCARASFPIVENGSSFFLLDQRKKKKFYSSRCGRQLPLWSYNTADNSDTSAFPVAVRIVLCFQEPNFI
jgi:hypothetical protein